MRRKIGKYAVESTLGSGAFGTVYKVYSEATRIKYAAKVSHNRDVAKRSSRHEASILDYLTKMNAKDHAPILKLIESFELNGSLCLIFPLMGRNLQDFLRSNNNLPFPKAHVQSIAKQLFTALTFLRIFGVVHCDIKSDNILLRDAKYFHYPHQIESVSVMRKVLYDTRIVLGDFGIARHIEGKKQTESYRSPFLAPELCINYPWDYAVDVYAVGLIMQEMRTGEPLIPDRANAEETLILLSALIGPLPEKLVKHASKHTTFPIFTTHKGKFLSILRRSKQLAIGSMLKPESDDFEIYRGWVEKGQSIRASLYSEVGVDGREFSDLVLSKALALDPDKRITAKKALEHPYFSLSIRAPTPPQYGI